MISSVSRLLYEAPRGDWEVHRGDWEVHQGDWEVHRGGGGGAAVMHASTTR